MRAAALVLALLLLAAPATAASDADARYQALLAAAQGDDEATDWRALRLAYAATPGFKVVGSPADDAAKLAMFKAYRAGNARSALKAARGLAERRFVDLDAHFVAAMALRRLGRPAEAAREDRIVLGLVGSIETGDGGSAASAFTIIHVDEEYALMRIRGREVTGERLVNAGGHAYDVLETTNSYGHARTFWFRVDGVVAAEAAALGPGR